MASPTKIQHPLLQRPGSSQSERNAAGAALHQDCTLIDGRSLGDLLDYIHQYARQLVFPQLKADEWGDTYTELNNWLEFFEKSLPFQLAQFGKQDFDRLEEDFADISQTIIEKPTAHNLGSLVDFCFFELVTPIVQLDRLVDGYEFDFRPYLKSAIRTSLVSPLRRYVQLSNTSRAYFDVGKHRFSDFTKEPWNLALDDTFALDTGVTNAPGGSAGAILWLKDELAVTTHEMLQTLRRVGHEVPNHIRTSLLAVQSRHEPHLGLLFAFLRLFSPFQRDLNSLTQKHLLFFYQEVLKIRPKESVQDRAHLVFQIANHLPKYGIPKGTVFKDGKDPRNADILFSLNDEIVIDKAEVKELKTLYLNTIETCAEPQEALHDDTAINEYRRRSVIEGVYIAAIANSADGKGEPFKDDQSKNWATLGAKTSKFVAPGKDTPENYPFGRIGFVLASPVLWLNEGRRDVTIKITCDAGANTDIFTKCFADNIDTFASKTFYTISEQTIIKIENLFSPKARGFLRDKLDRNEPIANKELEDKVVFSADEAELLRRLLETMDSGETYVLKEMPLASLVRYFNVLRLQQDPYRIGFDVEGFLQSADPVTCQPLIKEDIRKYVLELLDTETKSIDWFNLQFSGEEGWFEPKAKPEAEAGTSDGEFTLFSSSSRIGLLIGGSVGARTATLTFRASLGPDEPKVAFCDEDAVKEHFKLERPFPMVKIELNPEIQLACENHCGPEQCCLRRPDKRDPVMMALYQFFRDLKVQKVDIEVMVCGMRNVIVQNETSLQDVNSPISPFGPRPKIGAEFYIGNKELFCKNWQTLWIYTDWKDKPGDLAAYYDDYGRVAHEDLPVRKIANDDFKFKSAVLDHRNWIVHVDDTLASAKPLFKDDNVTVNPCNRKHEEDSAFHHAFQRTDFHTLAYEPKSLTGDNLGRLTVNSDKGFYRMTLRGVSFQHDTSAFVLASKMFKLAGKLDLISVDAILKSVNEAIRLRDALESRIGEIDDQLKALDDVVGDDAVNIPDLSQFLDQVKGFLQSILADITTPQMPNPTDVTDALDLLDGDIATLTNTLANNNAWLETILGEIRHLMTETAADPATSLDDSGVDELLASLEAELLKLKSLLGSIADESLPEEPYTPLIKSIEMDYRAIADNKDIDLIHLYPFANSSKTEYLELGPTLLPTFLDEGTLFIGLDNLRPGGSLQLLFQFAEATADSESERADINWHYLTGNRWQSLRTGFEILSDGTDGLTRSGIVKVAVPRDISNVGNTLMPPTQDGKHFYWIKASAPQSVAAVAELFEVRAQAASATWQSLANSDPNRVGQPLEPDKIGKPLEPDFSIKKVEQPYESFGGRLAEVEGHFYTRVSEHVRHKGRGVDIFDFEHLVLEAFPQLFECKCITHTFGLSANQYRRDLEVAPGFITVAVVPDLRKLKPGEVTAPKAPLSLLAEVKEYLQQRTSPFARIRVTNPRYEKIHVNVKVRLVQGRDETYYTAQLKRDLSRFLAPWSVGDSDKLSFGQHVVYSDVVGFIEKLDYVQFTTDLELRDSEDVIRKEIVPLTARSILTAGEICIDLDREDCNELPPPAPEKAATALLLGQSVSFPCGERRSFLNGAYKDVQPAEAT